MHAARMIARSSGKLLATPAARRTVGYSRTISVLPRAFKEEKAGGEQQQERREVAPRTGRQEEGLATPPQVSGDLLPFRRLGDSLSAMQREMDAMMSSFAPWLDDAFLAPRSSSLLSRSPIRSMLADLDTVMARGATMMPRVELTDEGSTYAVQVEVPGFSKEHINVELSEDRRYDSTILTIKGNTSEQQESSPQAGTGKAEGQAAGDQGEGGKAMAKRARSFAVSLRLPEDVDVDADTKASLEHGLLHLHLPKAAKHETEPKGKNIPVM